MSWELYGFSSVCTHACLHMYLKVEQHYGKDNAFRLRRSGFSPNSNTNLLGQQ